MTAPQDPRHGGDDRGMKPLAILAAALAVALAVVLLRDSHSAAAHRGAATHGLTGSLTRTFSSGDTAIGWLDGSDMAANGCTPMLGHPVVVTDAAGHVLARGRASHLLVDGDSCSVGFAVMVPERPLYRVTVAGVAGPAYTLEELRAEHFSMDLSQALTVDDYCGTVQPGVCTF